MIVKLALGGICVGLIFSSAAALAADAVVAAGPRTPEEERQALHVPPGFEVQLVACDPDIHKPLNIAFDARGRLWVTDTIEYPFPAAEGKPTRDTVKILEDFDETGKARKITTFAENLNIPVGILPYGDNGAIVHSIPNIWRLTDTQNTGHADRRDLLLGSIGHDDTHGMTGSFTEGFDGWIYAVHGFRNTSIIKASDGSEITLNSGNTYRFKPDGSHVEQFTHGQVNPFGMCLDPLGNLYTSDCETKPIALMMRGAYYSSFGKPDDGLGFAPDMTDHMYGSTAIAGLCDYAAEQFPEEYRNRMFVGNVVTNRINDAKLTPRGSAFHGDDAPDFVTTDDGWFRPVNIKLGPDGALYVSDFYNRIIGHYEVDLHHPGRDKQRGRIWRIVYKGPGATLAPAKFDLSKASVPELIANLSNPNFTVRMLAMNRLADVSGQPAVGPLKETLAKATNPFQKLHGAWVLYRLGALEPAMLKAFAADPELIVRVHAVRILAEMPKWDDAQHEMALAGLKDADPVVQRVSADALGRHPDFANVRPLLELRLKAGIDPFLLHTLRMALRDQLLQKGIDQQLAGAQWTGAEEQALTDSAAGAATPGAAAILLKHIENGEANQEKMSRYLVTVVRYVPEGQINELAKFVQEKFANDLDQQLTLFKSVQEGLAQRGAQPGEAVRAWGTQVASKVLTDSSQGKGTWTHRPLPGSNSANPWVMQMRASADGVGAAPFLSSLPLGESLTGIVRSPSFAVPAKLSFFMAGHNGVPPGNHAIKNIVRLRDPANDEVLAEAAPPRNDLAQKVTWDLANFAGRQGYIEATDGDTGAGFAWLAFGRFDPPVVAIPTGGPRVQSAVQIVESLHLTALAPALEKLLADPTGEVGARTAAAHALGGMDAAAHVAPLAAVVRNQAAPDSLREAAGNALGAAVEAPDAGPALVEAMHTAPQKLQLALAKALAGSSRGAETLLGAIDQGKASPRLLQDANVRERLVVAKPANLDERIKHLTQGLPAVDAQVQKLIDDRARAFDPAKASSAHGKELFAKNCAICHSIAGQGARIGPQLDGIGARGVSRLCEDILDPSRNVDAAFRYSTFVLDDGTVIAGIPRREEGQTITVADSTGKEVPIQKPRITRRVESQLSLMPSNMGEVISPQDFSDLLAYLLEQKQ